MFQLEVLVFIHVSHGLIYISFLFLEDACVGTTADFIAHPYSCSLYIDCRYGTTLVPVGCLALCFDLSTTCAACGVCELTGKNAYALVQQKI